ncbi:MAG: hypothetical protein D6798_07325 [Deltaproteobacteria bacterium]|nr:MAG: hypothetical protein D6798_07325 [Deltaproteobacteria bacterium]
MWILLPLMTIPVSAAGEGTSTLLVVSLDDRPGRRLQAPAVDVDLPGVGVRAMADDGSRIGDRADDGIWMWAGTVPAGETRTLRLLDGDRQLAALDLAIPAGDRAFFAYKLLADGSVVPDPAARPIERVGDVIPTSGDIVGAASAMGGGARAAEEGTRGGDRPVGDDEVRVRLFLDDRAVQRVHDPIVVVPDQGRGPVHLADDGRVAGDTPDDGIYVGDLVVQRTQYLRFEVADGDDPLGELTVFLPSTGQAEVRMRSTEGEPGIELAVEPTAQGANEGPASGGGSASVVVVDRLAHVVWVGVALFAIAFAWLRSVLWKAWTDEVRPVLAKLDRWLDAQAAADAGRGGGEPGDGT